MNTSRGSGTDDKVCDSDGKGLENAGGCSMNSVNGYIRYEMRQLGNYVSLLEFSLKERYYRYSQTYYGGHRAKVIDKIRVMVFIPF